MFELTIHANDILHVGPEFFSIRQRSAGPDNVQYVFAKPGADEIRHDDPLRLTLDDLDTGNEITFETIGYEIVEVDEFSHVAKFWTEPIDPLEWIDRKLVHEPSFTPVDVE